MIVVDDEGGVLAVGRAVLTGKEMRAFKRGVAVRVRRGLDEERKAKVKKERHRKL